MNQLPNALADKKMSRSAYIGRWLCVPFAAALGFFAATILGLFLATVNQWYIGATDDSGYVWIFKKIALPILQGAGFVYCAVLCAPSHRHETRIVFITLPCAAVAVIVALALYHLDFVPILSCAAQVFGLFFGGNKGMEDARMKG